MPKTIPPGIRLSTPEMDDRPVGVPVSPACSIQGLPNRASEVYSHFYCRLLGKAGSMLANGVRRHTVAVVGVCALGLLASACGGDAPADPVPTSSPSSSTVGRPSVTPTSPAPSSDLDAWRSDFSSTQLEAYDAALARWEAFESRSEPIWAAGEATPAARAIFDDFLAVSAADAYFDRLKTYEQVEVTSEGLAAVYWSRAKTVSKQANSVQIVQCVGYTTISGTQRGEPVVRPAWLEKPQLRRMFMSKPDGYDWIVYGVVDASSGKSARCTP
jgi:hypothetical protein